MIKSRITAAIWPWGTTTREQMETAARAISEIGYESFESVKQAIYAYDLDVKAYREVLDRYNIKPVSFYFHLPQKGMEAEVFGTLDKELEFVAELGVKRLCLQATIYRPKDDNGNVVEMNEGHLAWQLDLMGQFAEKTLQYGIMTNLHPHKNTWVMYENEIDNIFMNLDSNLIKFAPDTAHLVTGNCDPYKVMKKYADRINFTHFKDIKTLDAKSAGLATGGMEVYSNFLELGQGSVDFRSIFDLLKETGYDGPLCEELDRAPVSNEESARNNFKYILENY